MDEPTMIDLKEELRSRYGAVRRAGDCHLYTAKGKRVLDLCQEGGAAILGWRSGRSKLAFKNILDRGITGTFPSEAEGELVRAVQELLPQYGTVRWYSSRERARAACATYLGLWSEIPLIESPLLHPEATVDIGPPGDSPLSAARTLTGIPLWRPWLDDAYYSMTDRVDSAFLRSAKDTQHTMVLVSPFPFAGGCSLAVFSGPDPEATLGAEGGGTSNTSQSARLQSARLEAAGISAPGPIPPSDDIAPALLGALARAFADLAKALYERTESDWSRTDRYTDPFWDRRGPYLVPKMRKARYPEFFASCLDKGILISPEYDTPSIVPFIPGSASIPGEIKLLAQGKTSS
jgi:hypothetical protein